MTRSKQKGRQQKTLLIGGAVLVVVLTAAAVIFGLRWLQQNQSQSTKTSKDLTYSQRVDKIADAGTDDRSLSVVVEEHGVQYDESIAELLESNPTDWNQDMVNKAFFSLVYADKISDFTQVSTLLSMIDQAKAVGVNIDSNSYGVTQAKRDEISARAEAAAKAATEEVQGE